MIVLLGVAVIVVPEGGASVTPFSVGVWTSWGTLCLAVWWLLERLRR